MPPINKHFRRVHATLTATVVLTSSILTSQASFAQKITVPGSGNETCGLWIEKRKTSTGWHQPGQWISGYYTAAQEFFPKEGHLKKVDGAALRAMMDLHCASNPQDTIFDAMVPIILKLIETNKSDK